MDSTTIRIVAGVLAVVVSDYHRYAATGEVHRITQSSTFH